MVADVKLDLHEWEVGVGNGLTEHGSPVAIAARQLGRPVRPHGKLPDLEPFSRNSWGMQLRQRDLVK